MRLPSGQQIARLMDVTPLTDEELYTDHRIEVRVPIVGNVVEVLREFDVENQDLKTLFEDPGWDGEAPLWFYILKEAEIVGRGREMGPVGGRIVAEVLVALMQRDANSYLLLNALWKPTPPMAPKRGQFTMADLLKFAGVWFNKEAACGRQGVERAKVDREQVTPPGHCPAGRSRRDGPGCSTDAGSLQGDRRRIHR